MSVLAQLLRGAFPSTATLTSFVSFSRMQETDAVIRRSGRRSSFQTDSEDATAIYDIVNEAVILFGPNIESNLKASLLLLGQQKGGFGVDSESVTPLGKAIFAVLEELLGRDFTEDDRRAWKSFLRLFCTYLRVGINASRGGNTGLSSQRFARSSFAGTPLARASATNAGFQGAPLAASL